MVRWRDAMMYRDHAKQIVISFLFHLLGNLIAAMALRALSGAGELLSNER